MNVYTAAARLSAKKEDNMNIVIPLAGRVRMCIRSSFVVAQRTDAIHFDLTGDSFNLM